MNTKDQLLQIITDSLKKSDNITNGLRSLKRTFDSPVVNTEELNLDNIITIVANQNVLLKQLSEICLVYVSSGNYENDAEIHNLKISKSKT